jgi:UDP-N-acetylmuramate dehydrogenase
MHEYSEITIKYDVELSPYTTYRIGGKADCFIEARSAEEMKRAVAYARSRSMPFFVLGGGSNVLFDDEGVRGLVIRNLSSKVHFSDRSVSAESGVPLATLLSESQRRGLAGLEFLAGIPGSLGGAIFGNAGAYGKCVGDCVEQAVVITPDGEEMVVPGDSFRFCYRSSRLKTKGGIVLSATLALSAGDPEAILHEMKRITEERRQKHPAGMGSCGCYFKNVDGSDGSGRRISAGRLLEEAGAKEMAVGKARVSPLHANFIVNPGGATAEEIRALGELCRQRVKEKFGIRLEEEVRIVGKNLSAGILDAPCDRSRDQEIT